MGETASLVSLFIGSFLAATLLPGGSEVALFALLKAYPEAWWSALAVATLGNTLGGMVTFAMGWLLPQWKGGSHAAGYLPAYSLRVQNKHIKHLEKVRQYGAPILLFAWLPLVGDALCLGAGWLRLNPWQVSLFMAIGKFTRYWIIALASN